MTVTRVTNTDWPHVREIHDKIIRKLTLEQYIRWTEGAVSKSIAGKYLDDFRSLHKVTRSKRLLDLAAQGERLILFAQGGARMIGIYLAWFAILIILTYVRMRL